MSRGDLEQANSETRAVAAGVSSKVGSAVAGLENAVKESVGVGEAVDSGMSSDPASVMGQLAEAAEAANSPKEAKAIYEAVQHTPGLSESGIAPDVLDRLLPDEGTVVLPRVERVGGSLAYRVIKRAFDVVSCSLALVLLAIPMCIIAVKIRRESPGPVIFAQRRVGANGKVFQIYKFRSMRTDAEVAGAQWASEGDPRVTPFGRTLRKTRLDEVPQFWNVVRGDMSLVGPRPERPAFHEVFCERIDGWGQRTMVRPGITGLAQISGGYDLLPKEKALYDIAYIEGRGIKMDLSIMWRTVRTMITGDGAR